MTTFLPPPPTYPGKEAIPSSPISRLRSVDIRTWLLTFAVFCVFLDLNEVLVSILYYGFSSKTTVVLLVGTALDLILLHAALTNEIISLKINKAIAFVLWYLSVFLFLLMLAGSSIIIFRFDEYKTHVFKKTDKMPTYGEHVCEALILTSIIGASCLAQFVCYHLVKKTLKKVQMERDLERDLEQLPIRTI